MNESEHTPGPWDSSERMLNDDRGYIAVLCESGHIADIFPFGGRAGASERPLDVHRANARLIAAAPEMYAALTEILRVDWERGTDWDTKTIMMSYLDAAKKMQAIAREAKAKADNGAAP